jgi:hypothetical protein
VEAELTRLTEEIQATQKMVEQADLKIGEGLFRCRATRAYTPDSFQEYCADKFGLLSREIYRYINTYRLVQATQEHLGETPLAPKFAERVLGPVARRRPEQLKAVQAELKRRGLSVATATTPQIAEAVKVVLPPKPKTVKAKPTN